jgi:hypothetical protein
VLVQPGNSLGVEKDAKRSDPAPTCGRALDDFTAVDESVRRLYFVRHPESDALVPGRPMDIDVAHFEFGMQCGKPTQPLLELSFVRLGRGKRMRSWNVNLKSSAKIRRGLLIAPRSMYGKFRRISLRSSAASIDHLPNPFVTVGGPALPNGRVTDCR